MKATCKRESLIEALDQTKPCKGKGQHYLATRDGRLVVFTADLPIGLLMAPIKATIGSKGVASLSSEAVAFLKTATASHVVLSTARKVRMETVELEKARWDYSTHPPKQIPAKKGPKEFVTWSLKVEAGKNSATFPMGDPKGVNVHWLSEAEKVTSGDSLTLKNFGHILGEVRYAVKSEEPGFVTVFNGVGLAPSPKGIDLVGTDNIRLAVTTIKTKAHIPSVTIRAKAADILLKAEKVKFFHRTVKGQGTYLAFQFNGLTLLSASIGEYAKYQDSLPQNTRRAVSVYSDDLREAIGTAMTTVGRQGAIRLMGRGKTLRVVGMAGGKVAQSKINSKGRIQQAYEARYLLDVLQRAGEVVDIRLPVGEGPLPAIIKNNGSVHLICARQTDEWDIKTAKVSQPKAVNPRAEYGLDEGDLSDLTEEESDLETAGVGEE